MDSLTYDARRAVKWVIENALPGSLWRLKGRRAYDDVFFKVSDFAELAHPELGCVLQLNMYVVREGSGKLQHVTREQVPDWCYSHLPDPNHVSALALRELAYGGKISKHLKGL